MASAVDSAWLIELAAAADANQINAYLEAVAKDCGCPLNDERAAEELDKRLNHLPSHQREQFLIPKNGGLKRVDPAHAKAEDPCTYLVGNSLGLQPSRTRQLVNEELDAWANLGVNGHFDHVRAWMPIDELVMKGTAEVVGALESEVAVMNTLTMNLHLLFISFYRPEGKRNKIIYENDCFGSDYFAFMSQAQLHGLNPDEVLVPLKPRDGEFTLRTEDVLDAIAKVGDELAVVCFGTVQYYTGQLFDVPVITKAAQTVGAAALWDCAHAAGNIDLRLHDWGVDGACWCNYKYLNSGPGAIAGFFVHEKHHKANLPILSGWWGQQKATRFNMQHEHRPEVGAMAWRLSNPPVLQTVALLASLEVFGCSSMAEKRGRSFLLTSYLLYLVKSAAAESSIPMKVITPEDPKARGCQLSLQFDTATSQVVFDALERRGVVVDHRKPDVIRVAPCPLYSTFRDVHHFAHCLGVALMELAKQTSIDP